MFRLSHHAHTRFVQCASVNTYTQKLNVPLCLQDVQESSLVSEYLMSEIIKCYRKDLRGKLLTNLKTTDLRGSTELVLKEAKQVHDEKANKLDYKENDLLLKHAPPKKKLKTENKPKSIMSMLASRKSRTQKTNLGQCPICNDLFPIKTLQSTHIDQCLNGQTSQHAKAALPKPTKSHFIVDIDDEETSDSGSPSTQKNSKNVKRDSTENSSSVEISDDEHVLKVVSTGETSTSESEEVKAESSHPELKDSNGEHLISSSEDTSGITEQSTVQTPFLNAYLDSAFAPSNAEKQRIPKLDTSNLALSSLKSKLQEWKLPTTGTKSQMVNRYNHWEMLWNSNFVDSLDPVSEKELRAQLHVWEKHNNIDKSETTNKKDILVMFGSNNNAKIELKSDNFSRKNWSKINNQHYRRLAKQAKNSMKKKKVGLVQK
ncbi:hypothetical protein ACO0QE_003768 [Hanseniaspora vineae]